MSSYEHEFSGARCPLPDEARGGIIADEMGLGKSLVILSAIAGSFDLAKDFFATQMELREENPGVKIPSIATLIVAPSTGMLHLKLI